MGAMKGYELLGECNQYLKNTRFSLKLLVLGLILFLVMLEISDTLHLLTPVIDVWVLIVGLMAAFWIVIDCCSYAYTHYRRLMTK